ncbi:unnamed protein product [Rhodiola kirilowii]
MQQTTTNSNQPTLCIHGPLTPRFNTFRLSVYPKLYQELIECKHPTAWIEFAKGQISEMELARKFFKDERYLDLEGLKNCMISGYSYIEGVEELLRDLKHNEYEMHTFTNYPIW